MERILCSTMFIRLDISPLARLWMLNWVAIHPLFGIGSSRLGSFFRRVQHGKLVMAKLLVSTATNGCPTHLDLNLV